MGEMFSSVSPFVFVLGHTSLFGQSSSLSGRSDDDERRIRIHRSSFCRHIAVSDVAPGMCVSKAKGKGRLTVHGDDVGRRHCPMAPKRGWVWWEGGGGKTKGTTWQQCQRVWSTFGTCREGGYMRCEIYVATKAFMA